MFITVVLIILILILVVVKHKVKNQPPGPFPWPVIGNQFLLKRLTHKLGAQHFAFIELSKRYNSHLISLGSGANKVLVVSGSESCMMEVLKSEEFEGRPWNAFIEMRNMGKKQGITMNDGDEWREIRGWTMRTMRSFGFGKQNMLDMIKNELNIILDKMKKGGVQRLKPMIVPAVLNVLWMLTTGKPFGDDRKLQYFTELLERRARAFDMNGGFLAAFPWLRYVAPETSGYNLLVTLNNELKAFLMDIINEHKLQYSPENNDDLIDLFLHEMYSENSSSSIFNEDQLVMVLIDFFLAGCTTTATSMDFLFLIMVLHQDVQRKLQQEIDSVIPRDEFPELKHKIKLPYTEAVITESQRLWPPFPIIGPRRCLRDTNLGGYKIPKDSTILLNMYSIHVDPVLYPDPHTFNPERFIKDGVFEPNVNSLSFGKGRRRCPGEMLAKSAMFLLFTGIMQKYTLLPVPGKGPTSLEINPGLTISPKPYQSLVMPR
ncbi:probable cytochrome P450 305a1 [Osmia bicornis bicornis]|uniref:probable cytochrome P450 305a1 n=1 Tax=Osmia bicornis bicornis TaxID=1437191 RepID=UPI001EAEE2F4|nr:probable cytochrome P450 305a1 [Osmia bicornis bicornis]